MKDPIIHINKLPDRFELWNYFWNSISSHLPDDAHEIIQWSENSPDGDVIYKFKTDYIKARCFDEIEMGAYTKASDMNF